MNENIIDEEKKKQVIGLYGEMQLAMKLHAFGWQVHRSYIDEGIDFVISRYYCKQCEKYTTQYIRQSEYKGKKVKCVTNCCNFCQSDNLQIITRYLQVKTSEGIKKGNPNERNFSFHPKIRYDMDKNVFYVWIAVFEESEDLENAKIHYYIFNTKDVARFDDVSIDTYQITDNQKTSLSINTQGEILNRGKKYSYECFKEFHNNFNILERL